MADGTTTKHMFRNKRASLKTADLVHRVSLRGSTGRQPGCSPESLFSISAATFSSPGSSLCSVVVLTGVMTGIENGASCIAHQKKYRTRVPLRQTESEEPVEENWDSDEEEEERAVAAAGVVREEEEEPGG